MKQSAVEVFGQKISALKEQGLKNIQFSVENTEGVTAEQFAEEANRVIDVMVSDAGEPLLFNDSKKL